MKAFKFIAALAALLIPTLASAQSPVECGPTGEIDALRLYRQASLDLRGQIPSYDEMQAIAAVEDRHAAVEAAIDAMLDSDEYYRETRRAFQVQLWSTLDRVDNIVPGQRRLATTGGGAARRYFQANFQRTYRGRNGVTCLDQPQTEFDSNGRPVPITTFTASNCRNVGFGGNTCVQEGYVMVRPFWNPSVEVKVCAFDAMTNATGYARACDTANHSDRGCGCGTNLRHCMREADTQEIRRALEEEPGRIFESIVREGRPLVEAFTTRKGFVNGPAAHYYRFMSGSFNPTAGSAVVYEPRLEVPGDLSYGESDRWVEIERGEEHAGVLTSAGYLLRFASNRSRANRFYTAFYCDPFVPSGEGLPAEEADPHPNLRERTGCADCHQVLEPAAARWGRWRNGGTFGYMSDEVLPMTDGMEVCECGPGTDRNNCSAFCNSYFVTMSNSDERTYERFGGRPLTAAYLVDDEAENAELGPSGFVDTELERSRVASCAVRTAAQRLLGRPVSSDELEWLQEQTVAFQEDGLNYSNMVRRIVADERYRTMR